MSEMLQKTVIKGGEFLVRETTPDEIFIPEDADEESLMMKDTAANFIDLEVNTNVAKIEKQQDNIAPILLEKAGELGLLGGHIPEEYGGMNLHTNTNTLITEEIGKTGSWTTTYAAHIGIGMLPILYFGTEDQKKKYLPGLVSGQLKACYCLTEPGSGSDALAAKTRAVLTEDGKYYSITGQKMWISNAGFADVFIVFAKIEDGGKGLFTGFIVEKGFAGLSLGAEEDKMGIKGSSTRQVFFENMKVPVENVLGEIGKGHHIAFNILNVGRFKLGALCVGGCKRIVSMSGAYAAERHQFGVPIGSFGAIKYKLSEQATRTFALESAVYRISNLLQEKVDENKAAGESLENSRLNAAEEYAIECALIKVFASETLDYCVDENVQIYGGLGFSEEYPAARAYRDSRICRIYEGTNEINRLLSVDMLLKRAMQGHINITDAAWAVQKELTSMPTPSTTEGEYAREEDAIKNLKKCLLMVAGAAVKQQIDGKVNLKNEQEILMNVADIMMYIFSVESTLLRVKKLADRKTAEEMTVLNAILRVHLHEVIANIRRASEDALTSFTSGDMLDILMRGVTRFTKVKALNVKDLRRVIADKVLATGGY